MYILMYFFKFIKQQEWRILEIFPERIKRPETSQYDVKWWTSPENPLTPSTLWKPE